MNQQELVNAVKAKKGFVRVISDNLAPDSIKEDSVEKRFMQVEHVNGDGTAGITNVYYMLDKVSGDAKFYNTEPESLDHREATAETKKEEALKNYLKTKYQAYFIKRVDLANNWAEAEVFVLSAGKLTRKSVLVFKRGTDPIGDIDII